MILKAQMVNVWNHQTKSLGHLKIWRNTPKLHSPSVKDTVNFNANALPLPTFIRKSHIATSGLTNRWLEMNKRSPWRNALFHNLHALSQNQSQLKQTCFSWPSMMTNIHWPWILMLQDEQIRGSFILNQLIKMVERCCSCLSCRSWRFLMTVSAQLCHQDKALDS